MHTCLAAETYDMQQFILFSKKLIEGNGQMIYFAVMDDMLPACKPGLKQGLSLDLGVVTQQVATGFLFLDNSCQVASDIVAFLQGFGCLVGSWRHESEHQTSKLAWQSRRWNQHQHAAMQVCTCVVCGGALVVAWCNEHAQQQLGDPL